MLTPYQLKLYRVIQARIKSSGGVSPTYDEMRRDMGLKSKSGVHGTIQRMEKRGALIINPDIHRGIELLPLAIDAVKS